MRSGLERGIGRYIQSCVWDVDAMRRLVLSNQSAA